MTEEINARVMHWLLMFGRHAAAAAAACIQINHAHAADVRLNSFAKSDSKLGAD